MERSVLAGRCKFEARVIIKDQPLEDYETIDIQCANEEGHVKDHLILVKDNEQI